MIHIVLKNKFMRLACMLLLFVALPVFGVRADGRETGDSRGSLMLKWEKVEGALEYAVEIRDESRVVLNERVPDTSLQFSLPAGEYSLRIGAVNKFFKVDSWSDWQKLVVRIPLAPVIGQISEDEGVAGKVLKGIVVRGENLVSGGRLYLKRNEKALDPQNIRHVSDREINFDLDLRGAAEGRYSLVIENPGGLRAVKDGLFSVTTALLPSWWKTDYSRGNIRLCAGVPYYQITDEWGSLYQNSASGMNAAAGYELKGLDPLRRIPLVRNTGVELEFTHIEFSGKDQPGRVKTDMKNDSLGINVFYHTGFHFPVNGILRVGGGYVFTEVVIQSTREVTMNSRDLYYKAGISAEGRFMQYLILEVGIDYTVTMYLLEDLQALRYFARVGARL